jgi:hypothetical protein
MAWMDEPSTFFKLENTMKMIISLLTLLASMLAFGEYREGSLAPEGISNMPEVLYHAHGDEPEDDEPEDDEPEDDEPEDDDPDS